LLIYVCFAPKDDQHGKDGVETKLRKVLSWPKIQADHRRNDDEIALVNSLHGAFVASCAAMLGAIPS
jgi:hypothetical protein